MAEKDTELSPEIEAEIDELFRMCPVAQEPSLSLLRGHLLCEYYLERLITLNLPRGDKLTANGNLSFFQKVVLVDSLQIIDDRVMRGLKNLNAVRNQLSHQKDKEITHSDIERIGQSLGKGFTAARRGSGKDMGDFLVKTIGLLIAPLVIKILSLEDQNLKAEKKNVQ